MHRRRFFRRRVTGVGDGGLAEEADGHNPVGKGAAVNAVNNAGMTPMRYTVQRGSWVQALIDGDMSAVLGEQGRE